MKKRLLAKKISLIIIILFCIISTAYAYFLSGANTYNTYMNRFEAIIRKLSYNNEYSIPHKAIPNSTIEPYLTKNIESILQQFEEIADTIIY